MIVAAAAIDALERTMPPVTSPMDRRARFQLAQLGGALADASRAAMLVALLGGVAVPASELARAAGVAASTATSHLKHLEQAGVVKVRAQGRHRYFSLAGPDVAEAIERLVSLGLATAATKQTSSEPIALARTCYAHLAGRLSVAFWRRAREAGWVLWRDDIARLTRKGSEVLGARGLLREAPLELAGTSCLDWSERVPHVAGRLGVVVCKDLHALGWVKRSPGSRALRVTSRGEAAFEALGVRWREP